MEFNFDTKNIILFHYPSYSGGKFVMNCMGLSDDMVFQHQDLAQKQIDGNFSFDDKKEYILTWMKHEDILENKRWLDLDLGCSQLFIDGADNWLQNLGLIDNIKTGKQHLSITDTVKFLSSDNNNKWLFSLVWHSETLRLENFPNAKIITFKNNTQMIRHRSSFLADEALALYDKYKKHPWREDHNERVPDFTWDTEWLYDVTATMNGIEELYKLFNLDGWEQAKPFVKEYYHLWCEKNHI
jgi:hypothetical protein